MRLDSDLSITVVDQSGGPVAELLVEFEVSTGVKNPYFIQFPKTDSAGKARLSPRDLDGQWRDHWESGLMDYSGTVADASPLVRMRLFDVSGLKANRENALRWPLLSHERTKWGTRSEAFEYMASSSNPGYLMEPLSVDLERHAEVSIVVRNHHR